MSWYTGYWRHRLLLWILSAQKANGSDLWPIADRKDLRQPHLRCSQVVVWLSWCSVSCCCRCRLQVNQLLPHVLENLETFQVLEKFVWSLSCQMFECQAGGGRTGGLHTCSWKINIQCNRWNNQQQNFNNNDINITQMKQQNNPVTCCR